MSLLTLSIIFERSWRTAEVPEDWRKANVTPMFKKGKKEDRGNYRPVSLTSILGKMMEQLILEVIIKQVEEKKVIRNSQHGFTVVGLARTGLIFTRTQEGTQLGRLTQPGQTEQGIPYHVPSCWVPVGGSWVAGSHSWLGSARRRLVVGEGGSLGCAVCVVFSPYLYRCCSCSLCLLFC